MAENRFNDKVRNGGKDEDKKRREKMTGLRGSLRGQERKKIKRVKR